jgi:hypothetical protein
MKIVISTYVTGELAEAVDEACKSSGMGTSAVVREILKSHFLTKDSFSLINERMKLEELQEQKKNTELEMIDIERQIDTVELNIERIQNNVSKGWIDAQLDESVLSFSDDAKSALEDFNGRVETITKPWLKAKVDEFLSNGGLTEIESRIKEMISS